MLLKAVHINTTGLIRTTSIAVMFWQVIPPLGRYLFRGCSTTMLHMPICHSGHRGTQRVLSFSSMPSLDCIHVWAVYGGENRHIRKA